MKLYAYIRISRPSEKEILENQRIAVLDYAKDHALQEPEVFDEVWSGADENRPGLGLLLRGLRPGDIVIFTSLSRMTRGGVGAALDILRQLERIGAGWRFVEQPILDWDSKTPKLVKDIIFAVFTAIDEDYRRRISEATKAALARKKAGGWHGKGRMPGSKNRRSPPNASSGGR